MRFCPYNIYRTRVGDGQGGWTIGATLAGYVFGQFHYSMPDTEFFCGPNEDLELGDFIDIEGRYYIVREKLSAGNAPMTKWRIELADRPQIAPATTTIDATTTRQATTTVGLWYYATTTKAP